MKENIHRIMFTGPSGYGKTTLANWIDQEYDIPFVSGSVSDLIPKTKDMSHKEMLNRSSDELFREDYQIVNSRNKLFEPLTKYVTDRSYVDSVAYFIYKQADQVPACEIEHFISLCTKLLVKQCDCLIFLDFVPDMLKKWVTEDNNKRIVNNYFQLEISRLIKTSLDLMGYKPLYNTQILVKGIFSTENLTYGAEYGIIDSVYGKTRVFIIRESDLKIRQELIHKHLFK